LIYADQLSFTFKNSDAPTVLRATFHIKPGEICLVAGKTGSGKSTLLKMLNGLLPHFGTGRIEGRLLIDSELMTGKKPHDFTHLIGYVNQQPENSFVARIVEDELAFTLEQLGVERAQMHRKIQRVAETLRITELLGSEVKTLSGGEQQKVAIAAALVAGQRLLLLDEPTSALDDDSAMATLSLLKDLAKVEGLTILIAEHRLERVAPIADSLLTVFRGGSIKHEPMSSELLSKIRHDSTYRPIEKLGAEAKSNSQQIGAIVLNQTDLLVQFDSKVLIKGASVQLREREITAIIGPNGSGKTSLLWALAGKEPSLSKTAMVPQIATDLLFLGTLSQELHESDTFSGEPSGTTGGIFESLVGRIDPRIHPRDLSTGQQLSLVLAMQLTKSAPILLLDEPTRGLDHSAKQQLAMTLSLLRDSGKAILITSHDLAFVKLVADRTLEIKDRDLVEVIS
jgi:energy-coupling factor transporter ATP-binding protein EcfA2